MTLIFINGIDFFPFFSFTLTFSLSPSRSIRLFSFFPLCRTAACVCVRRVHNNFPSQWERDYGRKGMRKRGWAGHQSSRLNWKVKGLQVLKLNFCVISINRFSFVFFHFFSFHFFGGRVCSLFSPITIIIICCHFLSAHTKKKLNVFIDCYC